MEIVTLPNAAPFEDKKAYRFWKRELRNAGKQRCWNAIAPRIRKKVLRWRPTTWDEQIPVDSNLIKDARKQLLEWLAGIEPTAPKNLLIFNILKKHPGMIPFRRTIEIIMALGLRDSMAKNTRFEQKLFFFLDNLKFEERKKFYVEINGNAASNGG